MVSKGVLLLVMIHLLHGSVHVLGSYFGSTTVTRGGSGVKIGSTERGAVSRGLGIGSGRGNSGIRIGEGRIHNSTRQRPIPTTSTTTASHPFYTQPPEAISHGDSHTDTHADSSNITYLKVSFTVASIIQCITRSFHVGGSHNFSALCHLYSLGFLYSLLQQIV